MIDPRIADVVDQTDDLEVIELSAQDARIITLLSMGLSPGRVCADLGVEMSDIRRVCAAAGAK